jgi:hypothetical protein
MGLLKKEKDHALDIGDWVIGLGAIFLIAALIGYIAEVLKGQK